MHVDDIPNLRITVLLYLLQAVLFFFLIKGVALPVLAQAVSVLISLLIIRKREHLLPLSKKDLKPDARTAKKIFMIGTPVALQELLVGFSFVFIQSTVNAIGVIESDGVGIGEKLLAFLMLVGSSYMQAMAAFTA